jgi:hypothetical protein
MNRSSFLLLGFSVAFLVFFFGPAFMGGPFGAYPLMNAGSAFDLLTPLVLIPLYWLLFEAGSQRAPSRSETVVFLVLAALWVEGQGMHLAANSIAKHLKGLVGTDAAVLTSFYDERLGHYLWHGALLGLAALLLYRYWQGAQIELRPARWAEILAGAIHGFAFAAVILEGGTVAIGAPFAVLAAVLSLVWNGRHVGRRPLQIFFLVAFTLATLLFVGWRLAWGEWIEPSEWLGF